MTTASTRIWTFAAVILMIVVLALGWFLGASPTLTEAARYDTERRNVEAQNDIARVTIAQLESDFQQITDLRDELSNLRAEFPTQAAYDTAVDEFLRGMLTAGVALQSISLGEPTTASAEAAAEGDAAAPATEEGAGVPAGSLISITVNVTVGGSLEAIMSFINALQVSPRFSIVPTGNFSQGSDPETRAMSFQLIMYAVTGADLPEGEGATP